MRLLLRNLRKCLSNHVNNYTYGPRSCFPYYNRTTPLIARALLILHLWELITYAKQLLSKNHRVWTRSTIFDFQNTKGAQYTRLDCYCKFHFLMHTMINNIRVKVMVNNATFNNILSYIVAICFIDGGNRSTWRKPPTCRKSLTNFITYCFIEYTSPRADSNSQLQW